MDARRKQELKELMVTAWNLARFGANRFGGPTSMYFWMALRIACFSRLPVALQILSQPDIFAA